MNNMKKSIKRIFWLIFFMFFLLIASLMKTAAYDRAQLMSNAYNPRLNYFYNNIRRGDIRDIHGVVLATDEGTINQYQRIYPNGKNAAHITGYTGVGKTGIEAVENYELQKPHNEILQRIDYILNDTPIQANHIITTIDMEIQNKAIELLGNQKGAVIVMEPSTGRIIAMVSNPSFDPNQIVNQWDNLRQDKDSPLLNRAAQGLYPPGSTFKLVTALAAMQTIPDWETMTYECSGEAEFENKVIHCFDGKAHGTVNIHTAMAVSCNCFFAELGKQIGAENIKETAVKLHLSDSDIYLPASNPSSVPISKNATQSEIVETAIGQGRTTVTPLSMAMLASSVANGGQMMKPYLVDHIEYYNGKEGNITVPEKIDSVMTLEQSQKLTQMMIEVVNIGTGTAAGNSNYQVAGKTGTAENPIGADHSWFIGFAPVENPSVAVAVVLENSGNQRKAAPLAGKIIQAAMVKK